MSQRNWAMIAIYVLLLSIFLNIILIGIAVGKSGKKGAAKLFDPFSPIDLKMQSPSNLLSTGNL